MPLHDPHIYCQRHGIDIDTDESVAFVDLNDPPQDLSSYDHVFFHWAEYVMGPIDLWLESLRKQYQCRGKISAIVGGCEIEDLDRGLPENVTLISDWVHQCAHFNRFQIDCFRPRAHKPYIFEALLGQARPNRTVVFDWMQSHPLRRRFLLNIERPDYFDQTVFDLEIQEIQRVKSSSEFIPRLGLVKLSDDYYRAWLAQVIPAGIYDSSHYSIVSETRERGFFLNEKTLKPMIGRRVFVAFAGAGHLRILHKLGFRTFASVIDESYDAIVDNTDRYQSALAQVQVLCDLDPKTVYDQCSTAIEHNWKLATDTRYWDQKIQEFVLGNL